jgi:hypothetical protein
MLSTEVGFYLLKVFFFWVGQISSGVEVNGDTAYV